MQPDDWLIDLLDDDMAVARREGLFFMSSLSRPKIAVILNWSWSQVLVWS